MKNLILILLLSFCYACSLDNKVYPLNFESITKNGDNYKLIVSTETNLDEIKNKHHFTQQEFIATIKNRDFNQQGVLLIGSFETDKQQKKGDLYFYEVDLKITNQEKKIDLTHQLTAKDTVNGFLQLSYDMGRTYPTKSIDIAAEKFLNIK